VVQLLFQGLREVHPLVLLVKQLSLHPLQLLLVLFLHQPEGVYQFFNNLKCFFDCVAVIALIALAIVSLFLSFRFLLFELLLQLDDPEGELLYLLLVDVGEVLDVRVVELLDGLRQLGVDVDEFF
jgi:hypothetical protein